MLTTRGPQASPRNPNTKCDVMKFIDFSRIKLRTIAVIAAVVTAVVLLITHTNFFNIIVKGIVPVASSFVVAYFLDYLVRIFEVKLKIIRGGSIILSVLSVMLTLYLIGSFLVPEISKAAVSLYDSIMSTKIDITQISSLQIDPKILAKIQERLLETVMPMIQRLTNMTGSTIIYVFTGVQRFASGVISSFVTFSIAIYMLIEKKDLLARIKRLIYAYFKENTVNEIYRVSYLMDKIFRNFIIGKMLDSIIIGILTYIILLIFGFQYAVLIALVVGITNMIPYFGPFIGAVPAILITLVGSYNDPIRVLYMAIIILAIQQLDGLIIGPHILGDSVGVTPFWIIIAVSMGGATFGFAGMFLGVPTIVFIKSLIEEGISTRLKVKDLEDLGVSDLRGRR